jgi:hypothetical protein
MHKKIKRRLNSGHPSYYSVQNLLSSSSLSTNMIIRTYRTAILLFVLYRHKASFHTDRIRTEGVPQQGTEEYLQPKKEEVAKAERNSIMRSFITFPPHQILFE